jgi:hypothetical protein
MAIERGTDVEYIGNNSSGGQVLGLSSTELIGFYGKAPIARATMTAHNTSTTTGLASSVTRITAVLVNLGLIVTA